MPTYDFECQRCNKKFTVMISITERDKVTCPDCNTNRVRQVFTSFGIQVKDSDKGGCGSSCPSGGFS